MTESQRLGYQPDAPGEPLGTRWPVVIGTIGVVLAALIVLDKIDDLVMLNWTEADWSRLLGPDLAALVYAALPPTAWRLLKSLVHIGLGVLLASGALALRHRRLHGVRRCRLWAWLSIAWVLGSMTVGLILARQSLGDIPGLSVYGWQAAAAFGIIVAVGILLAFPTFLLIWFSRDAVRAEYESWAD